METNLTITSDLLDQIAELHQQGLYLQAYNLCEQIAPLQTWTGTRERVIGGRLAYNLGSHRLGRIMHRLAMQESPDDFETIYYYTLSMSHRRGPFATLEAMQEYGELNGASSGLQADWFALLGETHATLRDFEMADQWIDRALQMEPERPWLFVEQTYILEKQDRNDEAIAAAEKALELRPWYRPGVQNLAYRYVQANRDDEALDLLRAASEKIESGDIRAQLAALYLELERYEEAREIYSDIDRFYPLLHLDRKRAEWTAAMRADAAYYCGDFAEAARFAGQAKTPFYDKLAEHLGQESVEGKRVVLPVKFVRQHHSTCAPATLASISGFWDMEAMHLDVAEKICYDGTPAHSERRWAEENGFATREFRVTWETATELLDRGIPFTLTTVEPGSAHLQAVNGYDSYRKSILIRDPGERHFSEFYAEKMLEHYDSTGPRGMAMVPRDKEQLLDGIEFEDREFYDLFYQLELKLEEHKRDEAQTIFDEMSAKDGEHRLTLRAHGNLAKYDSDINSLLSSTEKLLEKYPKDANLKMFQLGCLQELGRREDRIKVLREINERPDCDPVFWSRLAQELVDDARHHGEAEYLIRRAIKYRYPDATSYSLLAGLYMDQEKNAEAVRLYRFAACLDDKNEIRAKSYFYAARTLNDTQTAIRFLQDRKHRFGLQSSLPARTLCWAYDQMENSTESLRELNEALELHNTEGDFLLYAADHFARYGQYEKAEGLLGQAKDNSRPLDWRRCSALIATHQGKLKQALEHWQAIVEQDPLDSSSHAYVAELTADLNGAEAGVEHLRNYVERYPSSYPLRMMLIEALRDQAPEVAEDELNKFLELHPSDAWALREQAFVYMRSQQLEKALEAVRRSEKVEPSSPAGPFARGRILAMQNQLAEARDLYRQALKLSIDYEPALSGLVQSCNTKAEREAELQFIFDELNSQVSLGDGLLNYRFYAQSCLEPATLLSRLRKALEERQDLWHAWSAVIHQLSDMQQHEEAIELAQQATRRFPMLPRIWIDRSAAHAACGQIEEEIDALRRANEINPNWGETARLLAEAFEKKGDLESARVEIERVIQAEPRDARNHGFLANIQWQSDQKEEALDTLAKAVRLEPGYDWAWSTMRSWSAEIGKPDFDSEVARELTESRPKEARSWLLYAMTQDGPNQVDDALAALDRGLELNPLSVDCHDQKAIFLKNAGRFEEALAACKPMIFGDETPLELVARAAWIEGELGNMPKAISDMEKVVAQDPDYYWAWMRLAEWYEYQNMNDKYLKAAEEMVRLGPQSPISWGYLGDGQLQSGKREEAKQHFLQAVQLAPSYTFASGKLLELLVEDKEFDRASELIDVVSTHILPEWAMSERIRIATLKGDQDTALQLLSELCLMPSEDSAALDQAVESMFLADWSDETLSVISRQIDHPESTPWVAYVFAHLTTTLHQWLTCKKKLDQLQDRPQHWAEGSIKFLTEAATQGRHLPMKEFIDAHRDRLRADNHLWEGVARAYADGNLYPEAIEWMADWKSRQGITPSSLFTLVCSYWMLKQDEQAAQVTHYVFNEMEPDGSGVNYLVFAAQHEIFYGDIGTASQLIMDVDPLVITPYYQAMYEIIISLLQGIANEMGFAATQRQLNEVWSQIGPLGIDPLLARTYRRCLWRNAKVHDKNIRAMWYKWRASRV